MIRKLKEYASLLGDFFDVVWFSMMVLISVGSVGGFFWAWYYILEEILKELI
jgi:hypothetical protein